MPASFVTSTPHDALFKSVFEHPAHAAAELRHILPEGIVDAIDWSSLVLEPGSFVTPELADQHSDLLFSARAAPAGQRILVFLLWEHQSSNDARMALRLLGYMVRIWDRSARATPDAPLPVIVPALLAQVPGGWTAPTRFSALFSPHRGTFGDGVIPDFTFSVDDLAHVSDDQLRMRALDSIPKVALWLMRDARDANALLRSLHQWLPVLDDIVRAPTGRQAAARLLRYVALVSNELRFEQFRDTMVSLAPATAALAMTIAEQLRAEGRAQGEATGRAQGEAAGRAQGEAAGRAQGEAAGRARALLLVFKARELQVPDDVRARVLQCSDVEQLDQWVLRAATVTHPEDIFEG